MFEIRIPRLGWSMEEGTFLGWLKQDGETVAIGDALFELEGEKATQEIEAVDAGVLRIAPNGPTAGDVVVVGRLLGAIANADETPQWDQFPLVIAADGTESNGGQSAERESSSKASVVSGSPGTEERAAEEPDSVPSARSRDVAAPPSVRRLARELQVPLHQVRGSGPAGRATCDDVRSQAGGTTCAETKASAGRVMRSNKASPRARRVAKELGIDWTQLDGSGRHGRVREVDVRRAVERGSVACSSGSDNLFVDASRIPVSSRRRTIADRMRASHQQTASVTLTTRLDATNLVSLRQQFKVKDGPEQTPSITDIVASVAARVLKRHRLLAARLDDDGRHLLLPGDDGLHIGLAVDTNDGLLVPVLRDVARQSLLQVMRQSRELIDKARNGRLSVTEMTGGVFTITNLGHLGIEAFTPVINLPETAILGLGAIRREPVVLEDDRVVPRDQMTLSLTFDHCRIDGAPAARFLNELRAALECPGAWLI